MEVSTVVRKRQCLGILHYCLSMQYVGLLLGGVAFAKWQHKVMVHAADIKRMQIWNAFVV
jgi:hypothetical protein